MDSVPGAFPNMLVVLSVSVSSYGTLLGGRLIERGSSGRALDRAQPIGKGSFRGGSNGNTSL